jgi:hypothetical protein
MDFLFAAPNGIAAFPAWSKRQAQAQAFECQIAYWIKTGRPLPLRYLGPVHPALTPAMLRAKPTTKAQYRIARDSLPLPNEH